ncbi:hypothetical protein, partial [Sulfitobacter sp. 1A12779]|uniref:hypothetical protein n=1 Tax=Sulfitobacter sp. 1A12779 TaxID=3368599 RepID=UPI0037462E74
ALHRGWYIHTYRLTKRRTANKLAIPLEQLVSRQVCRGNSAEGTGLRHQRASLSVTSENQG